MEKAILTTVFTVFLSGCSLFLAVPEPKAKVLVVPSDEYMVKTVYTNRFKQVVEGYFVPNSKMEEFAEMKKELEFFRSPEYKIYRQTAPK